MKQKHYLYNTLIQEENKSISLKIDGVHFIPYKKFLVTFTIHKLMDNMRYQTSDLLMLTSNNWSPMTSPAWAARLFSFTEETKIPPLGPISIWNPTGFDVFSIFILLVSPGLGLKQSKCCKNGSKYSIMHVSLSNFPLYISDKFNEFNIVVMPSLRITSVNV